MPTGPRIGSPADGGAFFDARFAFVLGRAGCATGGDAAFFAGAFFVAAFFFVTIPITLRS
jgi:hypothetical protein